MIKDLIKSSTREGRDQLLDILKEEAFKSNKRDSMNRRRDVIHPSGISSKYWCWRRWFIGRRKPEIYLRKNYKFTLLLSFMKGHKIHEGVQELLGNSGKLFGQWYCPKCGHKFAGFKKSCWNCGNEDVVYSELSVIDDDLKIAGHTDGLIDFYGRKMILEVKSMNKDRFMTLVQPLEKHKVQGGLYFDTIDRKKQEWESREYFTEEEMKFVEKDLSGILFLYLNTNNERKVEDQLREFEFVRSVCGLTGSSAVIDDIEPILETVKVKREEIANMLDKFLNTTTKLPERECENKSDYLARNCPAKKECFEEE